MSTKALCWLLLSFYHSWVDPGSGLLLFPPKPSKTISPTSKPKGNTIHRVHCAVSPEIVLWVATMLRCLHPRNEWGFEITLCDLHLFTLTFIYTTHSVIIIHACKHNQI
jgi:hypothetical protein